MSDCSIKLMVVNHLLIILVGFYIKYFALPIPMIAVSLCILGMVVLELTVATATGGNSRKL